MEGPLIVGRQRELDRLDSLLAAARTGTSGALVIRGEAGIGKTTLLREFERRAGSSTVIRATGIESESEVPFSSLAELLLPLRDHLDGLGPYQAQVLSGALALGPPVRTSPFAVGVATLSLLAAAAEAAGPVAVLVDDAHWIDNESMRSLAFGVRRLGAEEVLAVFAIRGESELFEGIEELEVAGLDVDASRELLERVSAAPIGTEVAEELHGETAGNPLALITAATLLTPEQLSGEHPLDPPLPVGRPLSDALRAQLDDLAEPVRHTLLVVAANRSGSFRTVRGALEELGLEEEHLTHAEERGLIQLGGPTVRFGHPILRSVVYHSARPADRRATHAALAHVTKGATSAEERAWHLAAAAVGPDEEVAAEMDAAAAQMLERSGYSGASMAYERAAELSTDERRRVERLLEAAKASQVAGRSDRAMDLLEEALPLVEAADLRAQAYLLRAFIGVRIGAMELTFSALQQEAQRIEEALPHVAAAMLSHAAMHAPVAGHVGLGAEFAERAYRLSPDPGSTAVLGAMRMYTGHEGEARRLLLGITPQLHGVDVLSPEHAISAFAALSLAWMFEHQEALRLVDPIIASARSILAPGVLPLPLLTRAEADLRRGDWTSAEAEAQEARRLANELGQIALLPFADAVLSGQKAVQGAEEACARHCEQALASAGELGIVGMEMFTGAARGMGALGGGRFNDAVAHLEGVRLVAERLEIPSVVIAPWRESLIEAYVLDGRHDEAAELLIEFEHRAEKAANAHVFAVLCRCRGLVDPGTADDAFAEAMSWHAEAVVPFERARTQLYHGEHLRRMKRRGDAQVRLRSAMRTFEALGARSWTVRTATALRTAGGAVRSWEGTAFQDLTPQELQVALAVSQGATNREAAAALFISPKTVEYHLGHIYRKLGIRSRTELARRRAMPDERAG